MLIPGPMFDRYLKANKMAIQRIYNVTPPIPGFAPVIVNGEGVNLLIFPFTLILSLQCETKAERHKKYCWTNEHKNHCPSTDEDDNNYCLTHEHKHHCPTYMNTKTADEEEKIIAQLMNRAISILCRQILWMPMIVLSGRAARSVIRPKYFLLCSHLH